MLKPIRRRKKSPKYIPQIAKKAIDPDRLSQIEQDNNVRDNIIFEDDKHELDLELELEQDQHEPIEPIPEGPLTADFIKLQHVRPPAIQNIDNITDWQRHLGISKPSNLDRMISNPYHNRPKTYRRNSFTNSNSPKQTSDKRIKKEINKQLKKEQETMINNSLIKPLTRRGIKVINQKTIYH